MLNFNELADGPCHDETQGEEAAKGKRGRMLRLADYDPDPRTTRSQLDQAARRESVPQRMCDAAGLAKELCDELNDRRNFPRKKVAYEFACILGRIIGPVFELEAFLNVCEVYDRENLQSRIDGASLFRYMRCLKNADGTSVFQNVDYPHAHDLSTKLNDLLKLLREKFYSPDDDPDYTPPRGGGHDGNGGGGGSMPTVEGGTMTNPKSPGDDNIERAIADLAEDLWGLMGNATPTSARPASSRSEPRIKLGQPRKRLFFGYVPAVTREWKLAALVGLTTLSTTGVLISDQISNARSHVLLAPHKHSQDHNGGHSCALLATLESFPPGSDKMAARDKPRLQHLAEVLSGLEGKVFLVGRADTTPIRHSSAQWNSNEDLAIARAMTVQRSLIQLGLGPTRLSIDEPVVKPPSSSARGVDVVVSIADLDQIITADLCQRWVSSQGEERGTSRALVTIGEKYAIVLPYSESTGERRTPVFDAAWTGQRQFTAYLVGGDEARRTAITLERLPLTMTAVDGGVLCSSGDTLRLDGDAQFVAVAKQTTAPPFDFLVLIEDGAAILDIVDRLRQAHPR